MAAYPEGTQVIGGVDTHKDLHVAAVVDHRDRVLGTESFPTTRHGYRLMLAWMKSFGDLRRVGVECSGSYGAGLLRYLQAAGVEVLEVTAPDKLDRRRRGKNDDYDAESAAHAAFAERHTVTPHSRDGMVESLRVLRVCRKTAVQAKAAIGSWVTFYNHRRPHTPHGGLPPPWSTSTESKPTGRHRQ